MTVLDSLVISLFGLSIVFVVLIGLAGIVGIQSRLVSRFQPKNRGTEKSEASGEAQDELAMTPEAGASGTALELDGLDDKTAAMIMAIVSHESRIPLNELQFKKIKAMN